jgi:transposase
METTRAIQAYCVAMVLYMALELSARKWVVLFSEGVRRRRVTVDSGDRAGLVAQIALAKAKLAVPSGAKVISCYEAGRDGFWLHRWLHSVGVDNQVIDPASIEVPQRAKRVKTDRVDAEQLMQLLVRWHSGQRCNWHEVRVPTVEQEDQRRLQRERERLKKERNGASNRIGSLLATQGLAALPLNGRFPERLDELRCWDGSALAPQLRAELLRQWERYELAQRHMALLQTQQRQRLSQPEVSDTMARQMRQLMRLGAVGIQSAWTLCGEIFAWRDIRTRWQLGALSGFAPTPYDSGSSQREQGIGKSGISRVRPAMIELSWIWLRLQPGSELSQWFQRRFGTGSKRSRRIGIVALARKLLIALWRYLRDGVIPAGAVLKTP